MFDDIYQKCESLYYRDYSNNMITLKSCDTKSCQDLWIICAIEINGQLVAYQTPTQHLLNLASKSELLNSALSKTS